MRLCSYTESSTPCSVALNSSAADKVDELSLFAHVLGFGLDKCLKRS